jgi:hypothetical protein
MWQHEMSEDAYFTVNALRTPNLDIESLFPQRLVAASRNQRQRVFTGALSESSLYWQISQSAKNAVRCTEYRVRVYRFFLINASTQLSVILTF